MNKKDLADLQREWYQKLKDDGFKDIEYFDANMNPQDMMYREATKFAVASIDTFTSTEQYYIEARQFLHSYSFSTDIDKQIWELHSDGVSYRKIAIQLQTYYPKVFKTINKYKKILLKQHGKDTKEVLVEV